MHKSLLIAAICSGQVLCLGEGIDLSGVWKSMTTRMATRTVPVSGSVMEIRQTNTTISLRPVTPGSKSDERWWIVYPIDGTVLSKKRRGHMATRFSGHWVGDRLVLETSGEGNLPWRRSKTTQILSLSENGKILTISFRLNAPELNYDVVLDKWEK